MKRHIILFSIFIMLFLLSIPHAIAEIEPYVPYNIAKAKYVLGTNTLEVLQIKKKMQELGYFSKNAELSGNYNSLMQERIKMFQKDRGQPQTGLIDDSFLNALYYNASQLKEKNEQVNKNVDYSRTLQLGNIDFKFPSFFDMTQVEEAGSIYAFYPSDDNAYATLAFSRQGLINNSKDYFLSSLDSTDSMFLPDLGENLQILSKESIEIDGLPGRLIKVYQCDNKGNIVNTNYLIYVFDSVEKARYKIYLYNTSSKDTSGYDYDDILKNIMSLSTRNTKYQNRDELKLIGYGKCGNDYGTKYVILSVQNYSEKKTVDGFTIRYYAKDVYGDDITYFGDIYQEKKLNITIEPDRIDYTDKIKFYEYSYDDAKKIYVTITKVHFTDGTVVTYSPEQLRTYSFTF